MPGPRRKGTPSNFFGRTNHPINPLTGKFLHFAKDGGEVQLKILTVVSEHYDYLICSDGKDENILIAKPWHLRRAPFTSTVDGIDYTWSTIGERDADDGSDSETQIITPSYIVGEELICLRIKGERITIYNDDASESIEIEWQEINSAGRCWAVS